MCRSLSMHAGLFPYVYVSFRICGSFSAYSGLCWLMGVCMCVDGCVYVCWWVWCRLFSMVSFLCHFSPVCVSLLKIFPYIGLSPMSLSIRTRLFSMLLSTHMRLFTGYLSIYRSLSYVSFHTYASLFYLSFYVQVSFSCVSTYVHIS